jgi:ribosome maturation factor RimP
LKKEKDYVRNMGKDIEIRTYRAINRNKEFMGTLKSYNADSVTITDEDGNDITFQKTDIALIRQAIDF